MILIWNSKEIFSNLTLLLIIIDSSSYLISENINNGNILLAIRDKLYIFNKEK